MAYDQLVSKVTSIGVLNSVCELLDWDQEVVMPPKTAGHRAKQMAVMAKLSHEKAIDPEIGTLIEEAKQEELNDEQKAMLKEIEWDYSRRMKVPASLVAEIAETTTKAQEVWKQSRKADDFSMFAPHLEKIVELLKKYANAIDPNKHPYEVLLQDYEPDLSFEEIHSFLESVREKLAPLMKELLEADAPDSSFEEINIPEDRQKEFSRWLAEYIGYDFEKGRLDVSAHPFTSHTRITTRFTDGWLFTIMSTLHESGHAFYEMNLPEEQFGTPLGEAVSYSVHESQSHFWDYHLGLNPLFWKPIYSKVQEYHKEALENVSLEAFVKAINKVEPGLIRVNADELTYGLHIVLRFEIEIALMEGKISVQDIPKIWNDKMEELLGIRPPSDANGCLQDTHWSGGSIGYFPTYLIGSIISAQLWTACKKAIPDIDEQILRGEFSEIHKWLKDNVHKHGRRYRARELVQLATGKPLGVEDYIAYLTEKYRKIHDL